MHDTRYRFLGRQAPSSRTRTPVLRNAAATGASETPGTSTMWLYDAIDSWGGDWGVSATEVLQALAALPADTSTIELHINSPGGEVYEAIAITNALRAHPAQVTAVVDSLAASAASFIAASADQLVMAPNSELMIHDAWGIEIGSEEDMRNMADQLGRVSNNIASIYQAKGGGDITDWRSLMLAETWFSADEAVTAGLADSTLSAAPPAAASASAAFDLEGLFRFAGRAAAPAPAALGRPDAPEPDARQIRHAARRHAELAARHGLTIPA